MAHVRKNPGCDKRGVRPDRKAQRKLDAVARQEVFDALPEDEKARRRGQAV